MSRLNWKGANLLRQVEAALSDSLVELDEIAVTAAKADLYPGHGELTGDLKRSVHGAEGSYNWRRDDIHPTPEMGSHYFRPEREGHKLVSAIGSGLSYAIYPHQGTSRMVGYHYLTNQVPRMAQAAGSVVARHARRHGL